MKTWQFLALQGNLVLILSFVGPERYRDANGVIGLALTVGSVALAAVELWR